MLGHPRPHLGEWLRFLRADGHVLRDDPRRLFQQAANQPDGTSPAVGARARWEGGLEGRPWLRWVDKPQQVDACLLTLVDCPGRVLRCGFSPDDRLVFSINSDGNLWWWDADSGVLARELGLPCGELRDADLSPDRKRVVVALRSGGVRVYDTEIGTLLVSSEAVGELAMLELVRANCCAYSPDGSRILFGFEVGGLLIGDAKTLELIADLPVEVGDVNTWAWSPDGARAASSARLPGGQPAPLDVWDPGTGDHLAALDGHGTTITACAFSGDGKRAIAGVADGTLRVWDCARGEEVPARNLGPSPGEALVDLLVPHQTGLPAAAMPRGLRDRLGSLLGQDPGPTPEDRHASEISTCVVSPDGRLIATASSDQSLALWSAEKLMRLGTLHGHASGVTTCAFSTDGRRLVSGSKDGLVKVWDVESGMRTQRLTAASTRISAASFSPDCARVALGSRFGGLEIREIATGTSTQLLGHEGEVILCGFSPDARHVISASAKDGVVVWDLATGAEIGGITRTEDGEIAARNALERLRPRGFYPSVWISAGTFSPDGSKIALGLTDGRAEVWNGRPLSRVTSAASPGRTIHCCAYSPDGRLIAMGTDEGLTVWEAATLATRPTGFREAGAMTSCAWSRDAGRLLAGSAGGSLFLLDVDSLDPIITVRAHKGSVTACIFDEWSMLSVSKMDRELRAWDDRTGALLAAFTLAGSSPAAFGSSGNLIHLCGDGGDLVVLQWTGRSQEGAVERLGTEVSPRAEQIHPKVRPAASDNLRIGARSVKPSPSATRPRGAVPKTGPAAGEPKRIGRNDPCPCGSGKKYCKCHGAR